MNSCSPIQNLPVLLVKSEGLLPPPTPSGFRNVFTFFTRAIGRSQWPRGLRRRSSAARLLKLWVRILPEAWMFVCCECCVLSGRGLCDGLITRPGESYRLWRVVVCDQETSKNEEAKARYWAVKIQSQWVVTPGKQTKSCYTSHSSYPSLPLSPQRTLSTV